MIAATDNTSRHHISVAPMMNWTDRHDRYFLRLITRRALLYTEMVTTGALLHGDADAHLRFHPDEHPVALQLGGCEPSAMAECARMAEDAGYDEVNINVGCPSDRVQNGRFGACLMREPMRVADCVAAMRARVAIPVTVKTRIGVDRDDSYDFLAAFAEAVASAGCPTLIVHARKAWLQGLSPKANREVPPLDYARVHRLKRDFPDLRVELNGGIEDLDTAEAQLAHVDGVMLGRAAYQRPYLLADVDRRFHGDDAPPRSREDVVAALLPYLEREYAAGTPVQRITRHVLGLFHGRPGGRRWRRYLSENAHRHDAGPEVLTDALAASRPPAATERAVA
ncbi:tRNA-dihydrouridine synthase A [Salinisphaera sp. PC39]|uniref:tRNA dihydrouridine(20/20a) synthase DusA n=1 Tax=Salinisphaera sp. PC39 TaxID=1304156 RepID=UPI00333FCDAD